MPSAYSWWLASLRPVSKLRGRGAHISPIPFPSCWVGADSQDVLFPEMLQWLPRLLVLRRLAAPAPIPSRWRIRWDIVRQAQQVVFRVPVGMIAVVGGFGPVGIVAGDDDLAVQGYDASLFSLG